jgi:tRNA nucleotidyltransferase/poly(A) polymerase
VKKIEEDLERRDLTINSIAYNPITKEIIDPFGGQEDIKKRKIRFTGNAHRRIQEDPVRMLRACRFLATNERFRFTENTFNAICGYSSLIENVAEERIQLEIIKAMKAKNAGNFFRALQNTSLLNFVFPRMITTIGHDGGKFHNETIFEHSVLTCDNIKIDNPNLKIAAFLHDIGKPKAFLLNSNGSFQGHSKFGAELAKKEY